jgi:pyruvate,water dikinase
MLTPLRDALDPAVFGGKASTLASALRLGLPVPDGFALSVEAALQLDAGEGVDAVVSALAPVRWAVRSSAVGEDGGASSFAGQHLTRLGVRPEGLVEAVRSVVASGAASGGYRARLGLGAGGMGVVLQPMVAAEVAGVLFTVDPVSGEDLVVVEAAWGLGEAVVAGLITPDHWALRRDGTVVRHRAGDQDLWVVVHEDGSGEEPLPAELVGRPALDAHRLRELLDLAARLDAVGPGPHDAEFAFAEGRLWLLQRRPVTTGR